MQNYLQVILTRMTVTSLLIVGAFSCTISQELYEEADNLFERRGFFEASSDYVAAYAKIKSDLELKAYCAFRAGECFRILHDHTQSLEWFDKAIGLRYGVDNPQIFLLYGDVLRDKGEFEDAIEWYNKFRDNGDSSVAEERLAATRLAIDQHYEPQSRYIVEPMYMLNSPSYDFAPMFASKNDNVLIFASSRESSEGTGEDPITGEAFMDLFSTTQDKNGRWSEPEPLGNTISTEDNEGSVAFDKRFKTIYFTRCVDDGGSNLACDIYYAPIVGSKYGASQPLLLVNREEDDSTQVGHPALSNDGKYLLFASDLAGGFGGKDIWFSTFDDTTDTWGTPENLGPEINTPKDEMFPTFRSDGSLYFSSNGYGGLGGFEICVALVREGDLVFSEVNPLPSPINSASDELGVVFRGMTNTGVFSSNRPGGKGQDDLYSFELPPVEFCYKAYVYVNTIASPVIGATITLESSEGEINSYTTDGEGTISLCEGEIGEGVTYEVEVTKEGFISQGNSFSTIGLTESTTFAMEYFLEEIFLEKEYNMPLVLYPLGSADLLIDETINSADSLSYLVDLLTRNEHLVIQLEAHTDSRGTSSSNKSLSQRRAVTCVDFLVSKGIAMDRLIAVGHGEDHLKITDANIAALPADDREDAHKENRRTVFKIVRYDYIPTPE